MIPHDVLEDCRRKADEIADQDAPKSWKAAIVIVALWLLLTALAIYLIAGLVRD